MKASLTIEYEKLKASRIKKYLSENNRLSCYPELSFTIEDGMGYNC
jgi:hypothetical protein